MSARVEVKEAPGPHGVEGLLERRKELLLLHDLTRMLTCEESPLELRLERLAARLPQGWWQPEQTAALVHVLGSSYRSDNYRPSPWRQRRAFLAGGQEAAVEVVFLGEPPPSGTPFLPEEERLLDSVVALLRLQVDHLADQALLQRLKEASREDAPAQPSFPALLSDVTAYQQAVAALQEERALLRALLENLPDGIYFKDSQHRFTRVNQAQARVLGLKRPEDAVGKTDADFFEPEHVQSALADERAILESGAPLTGKLEKIRLADGSARWVSASKAPLRDGDGKIVGTVGISRDVHELKALSERLEESDTRLKLALEVAKMGVWDWHASTGRSVWSETLERLCGLAPGSYGGREEDFMALVHPADRARVKEASARAHDTCSTLACEFRVLRPDGVVVWVADKARAVPGPDGKLERLLGVTQDVTESKEAEAALRASEARLHALLKNSSDIVVVVDEAGTILYQSASIERLLGYVPEARLGKNVFCFVHPDDRADTQAAFQEVLAFHGKTVTVTCRYKSEAGAWRVLETIASNHLDNPAVGGIILNTRDITEAHQAREHLAFQASLLENVKNAVVATDARGRITFFNAYAETLYGWSRAEALGKPIVGLTVAKSQRQDARAHLRTLAKDGRWEGEMLLARQDGSLFPALLTLSAITDARGERTGFIGISLDISDTKKAEKERAALYLREQQARADAETSREQIETLNAELERRLGYVSALHVIDQAITGSQSLSWTLQVFLGELLAQLKVDAACVLLYNASERQLEVGASAGFRSALLGDRRQRVDEGYAGEAAMNRVTVRARGLKNDPRVACPAIVEAEGFYSYEAVPLIAKGELKGVLEVYSRSPAPRQADWPEFLQAFAMQAAIAIDNLGLFEQLQRSNLELKLAYDVTLDGLARALDLRDHELSGHSRRVAELAVRLAEALGVAEEEMVHLWRGALLHDLGKMGVPEAILLKPGPLDDEELKLVRQHPQIAYDLLLPIPYLKPALDIPYCHHENYDGTGYPRGLKGKAIPLAARIFAVVDAYDALLSAKPDRPAWPRESVLAHLKEGAGRRFDPVIVKAFLRMLEA